ncbi:MAG: hypothetical protein Q7R49_01510 [Candidatus Daviesbacteria bacterium]|nr:hypothetical protein [Candidatus Daviesbacteria bacterium]
MKNPLKQEEKKPISFASVEMRQSSKNYWWIAGLIFSITVVILFLVWLNH